MTHRRPDEIQYKTGEQSAENPYTFVMSSEKADRVGDVIRADGWQLTQFKRNPIALFGHDHSFPIGSWKNVRVEGKRLMGDLVLAAKGTSDRIDEIRSLLEQRILKAVSVGFRVKDYEPIDEKDPWGAWDIKAADLFETSVVAVPAHQDALMTAKSLGISKATQDLVFGDVPVPQTRSDVPVDYEHILGDHSDIVRRRLHGTPPKDR